MTVAAKKGDLCMHGGEITTGSPDTTIGDQPAARVGDQHSCKSHPPGNPPWPAGPIVTGSSTVYINGAKAARNGDQCQCGAPGPAPPGAANPEISTYEVQPDDHIHELLAGEHELVTEKQSPPAPPTSAATSAGQKPSAESAETNASTSAPTPSADTITYQGKPGEHQNPYADQGAESVTDSQTIVVDSSQEDSSLGAEDAAPLGEVDGQQQNDDEGSDSTDLNLTFAMDLAVGSRSTSAGGGAPMDTIIAMPSTVYIG